jgi:hypothetical protein
MQGDGQRMAVSSRCYKQTPSGHSHSEKVEYLLATRRTAVGRGALRFVAETAAVLLHQLPLDGPRFGCDSSAATPRLASTAPLRMASPGPKRGQVGRFTHNGVHGCAHFRVHVGLPSCSLRRVRPRSGRLRATLTAAAPASGCHARAPPPPPGVAAAPATRGFPRR